MRRWLLLMLLLLAPALVSATNTSEDARLRVSLFDGAAHEGEVKLGREKLEVKGGRRVKVRYREVAALADPTPPTPDELRADHGKRAERIAEGDAPAWTRLGEWAKERGLVEEARAAFEKA